MSRRSSSSHPPRGVGNRWAAFLALTLAAAGAARCKAKADEFYRAVYRCDPDAGADSCGTTRAGAPMLCFAASQLGSIDYCAEPCDADASSDGFTCQSSARVQVCDP